MARARPETPKTPLLFEIIEKPDFVHETRAAGEGLWPVAGLDEAGRGPLAGPVVAAAVILDPERIPDGLDDSKRLTAEQRGALFETILGSALAVSFASISAEGIDQVNILRASLEAMRRAFARPAAPPAAWRWPTAAMCRPACPARARALIKGDQRSQSIAAASIVAKVMRDRMMCGCGDFHVHYGFEVHMGYATERHRAAIDAMVRSRGSTAPRSRRSGSPSKPNNAGAACGPNRDACI